MTTATDLLRKAVLRRSKSHNIAHMARELGVSNEALYGFAIGQSNLQPDVLRTLTVEIFHGHAVFDPEIDRLRPAIKQDPIPLGVAPPAGSIRKTLPYFQDGSRPASGPRPEKPQPKPPSKVRREGWVE